MKNENIRISVFMASYKHVKWLSEAIESVLNQTFADFEFIVVDDGSNDGSSDIIKNYAKKDKRIKYEIFTQNKGAISAIKKCYDLSSNEYIAIMNSDDVWELDKLEKQVEVFKKNKGVDIVFGLPSFIDEDGNELDKSLREFNDSTKLKTKEQFMNYFFFKGNCICHPTILIKKKCYEDYGFYKQTLRSIPDFEMWTRLFWHCDVLIISEVLIKFRKHSFNESDANISNIIRANYEYKIVLESFVDQVKTVAALKKIFPEYEGLFKVNKDILIPFYIAMLAMQRDEKFSKDFALSVLYKELEKEEVLKLLETNNLYSLVQLSKDIVALDLYNYNFALDLKREIILMEIPFLFSLLKVKDTKGRYIILKIFNFQICKLKYK